jgi:hypothetical protein
LAHATVFLTGSLLTYTVGAFIAAGTGAWSDRAAQNRAMPAIYGVLAAALVLGLGPPPSCVLRC